MKTSPAWRLAVRRAMKVSRIIQERGQSMQFLDSLCSVVFCRRCGKEKPLTTEYFYQRPTGKFHAWCKECTIESAFESKKSRKRVRPLSQDKTEAHFIKVRDGIYRRHLEKKFEGEVVSTRNLLDLHQAQAGKCSYTGLEYITAGRDPLSMAVHRVDREKGYVEGNVVLCCLFFVTAKNEWPLEKMRLLWTHLPQIPAL